MTLEQGTLLHGRYRIVDILGQGGMGSVYRAIDENLGVEVAVKENLFTTDEYSRQFRLEAVILANLRQPNLPRVTDHFVIGDQGQYLVMDYIEGEDLRQRMERMTSVPEEEVILIGAAMCDALAYLHTRKPPVLHRDVKPGNVKITPDGHIYLVDFGLAKVIQGGQATTTGARAMTPGYSPPEQYGTARTDPRSDIYSLAATLYAALTGVIPEDGLARVMDNTQLTPLRKRNPNISRRLAAAIEKAMEPYPDERFQTAGEFKQALLNSTSRTQQVNTTPLSVSPAPADRSKALAKASLLRSSDGEEESPLPLKRRRGCGSWLLGILFILLVSGAYSVWRFDPVLPVYLAGRIQTSWLSSPTPTSQPIVIFNGSKTVIVTVTPKVVPTRGPSPTATETLLPTDTLPPSQTPTETPEPTPLGGGTGEIAFASDRTGIPQIYLMNSDGSNQRQLTNETDGACQPEWSPDGQRLVYISPCRTKKDVYEGSNLYIINADGSSKVSLPTAPEGDFDPAWSPDGNQIAFTSLRPGFTEIYVVDLRTLVITRLTTQGPAIQGRQARWSPSGTQIVYSVKRFGVSQIWYMTDTGRQPAQLVRSGSEKSDYLPAWSPDGRMILYSETDSKNTAASWLMSIRYEDRTANKTSRFNADPPIVDVSFSPDGFWLVFESWPDKVNQDIYIMTSNGANRTRLTTDPGVDFDPVWRPRGVQIIFPSITGTPGTPDATSTEEGTSAASSSPTVDHTPTKTLTPTRTLVPSRTATPTRTLVPSRTSTSTSTP
jgi:serine/threonine protein kinase